MENQIKEWIIVQDSYEYNDEDYYQPEDEGYTLHENKLYTKEEADRICQELNEKCTLTNSEWNGDDEIEIKINPYHAIQIEL